MRNFRQKYPVLFGVIVGTLVAAAAAAAAWFIVTLNGSGQGSFGNASPIT
jgi:hypothetical protein